MERASLIITSNLRRAMETSDLISKRTPENCKICVLDFVREKALYVSDVPCLSKQEIINKYPKADLSFLPDTNFKDFIKLPEDHDQVDHRIQQFINFIKNYQDLENNEIILVSHYYFLKRLLKGMFTEVLTKTLYSTILYSISKDLYYGNYQILELLPFTLIKILAKS